MNPLTWASRLDGAIGLDEIADAECWDRCALGEQLDLRALAPHIEKRTVRHNVIDTLLFTNYPWLHEAGCEFADYMRDIRKGKTLKELRMARRAARAVMREMAEYIDDCGGAAEMRAVMASQLRTKPKTKPEWAQAPLISNQEARGGD